MSFWLLVVLCDRDGRRFAFWAGKMVSAVGLGYIYLLLDLVIYGGALGAAGGLADELAVVFYLLLDEGGDSFPRRVGAAVSFAADALSAHRSRFSFSPSRRGSRRRSFVRSRGLGAGWCRRRDVCTGGFDDFHYCGHRRVVSCLSLVDAWRRAQISWACRTVGCGHAAAHPRWRRGDHPRWLRFVHPRFSRVVHPLSCIIGEDGVQFSEDCNVFLFEIC